MATGTIQSMSRHGPIIPSADLNGPDTTINTTVLDPSSRYAEERAKRLHGGGSAQYVDLRRSEQHGTMLDDPWIPAGDPIQDVLRDGEKTKIVILGAGFGGILFAVNLIKQGIRAEDLMIVDSAGGFGGTWYWNRACSNHTLALFFGQQC
jgi:hypothetical protein